MLLVERIMLEKDNTGDERCELWPMEGVSAEAGDLAESTEFGTGEPQSETVRQRTAEGVAMACQNN